MIGSQIKKNIQEAKRVREKFGPDFLKGVRQKSQSKKYKYVGNPNLEVSPRAIGGTASGSWVTGSDKTKTKSVRSSEAGDQSRIDVSHGEIDLSDQENNFGLGDYYQTSAKENSKSFNEEKKKLPR